ncbi:hypothetical protein BSKO_10033 [Bryopsis sp. KO-2023]|nr:hypothetical protein BSKO_10033 [Bryopsis sp. KO-2023]
MTSPSLDEALARCKKIVFKNRIRIKEFFVDFDKLRCGHVQPNLFVTALSIAGLDRFLCQDEIGALEQGYSVEQQDGLRLVEYRRFCEDVDTVFTLKNLESDPLTIVPDEPLELLDKTRYLRSSKSLAAEDDHVHDILFNISDICKKKGILVKPMFDDAAGDNNSSKLVGHVTKTQFAQCLNVKLGLKLSEEDVRLVVQKYLHDDYAEMVNYIAFANTVDPPEEPFDPYKLR